MTVDELLSIMMLNQLPAQYDTLKQIKRNDAKNKDKVPSLQEMVETIKDDIKNRHQNHNVVHFASKSKGRKTGGGGKKPDVPQCTFCKKQGHIENNCTKKHLERADKIMQAVKEAKEQRQKKKEKEKSKDKDKGKGKETSGHREEKTKGAWDVNYLTTVKTDDGDEPATINVITAANTAAASNPPNPESTDEEILGLHQMIHEFQTLINNRAAKNKTKVLRTFSAESVWHTIIESGAQRTIFSNRELLHGYIEDEDFCQTGSGEALRCPGRGTAIIDLEGPNGTIKWRLKNVLWCYGTRHVRR
ncbi:MAG: hypothetical protein L6R37_008462 [Teloschistes peruensis]|nr:MAG: hypothetical protein L6R37_008462 [Teloschistes peruensis]